MKTMMTTKLSSTLQILSCLEKLTHQCQTSSLCQLWQKVLVNSSYTKITKIMDKLKLNMPTQNPSKYIKEEYQTGKWSAYLHACVPYGCHRDGKISPSKIMWTGSNTYENT